MSCFTCPHTRYTCGHTIIICPVNEPFKMFVCVRAGVMKPRACSMMITTSSVDRNYGWQWNQSSTITNERCWKSDTVSAVQNNVVDLRATDWMVFCLTQTHTKNCVIHSKPIKAEHSTSAVKRAGRCGQLGEQSAAHQNALFFITPERRTGLILID